MVSLTTYHIFTKARLIFCDMVISLILSGRYIDFDFETDDGILYVL